MSRRIRAVAVVVATAALGSAGCSAILGDDAKPAASASPTVVVPSAVFSTPAPTVTASPTPTVAAELPTSAFEDRPQVKAARRWANKVGVAINADERDLAPAKPIMTKHGRDVLPALFAAELGRFYPGPVPFTPTAVTSSGPTADVDICLVSAGFSRVKGSTTTDPRQVVPARLTMKLQDGAWRVDELQTRSGSCATVTVQDLTDPAFTEGGTPTATPAPSAPTPVPSAAATPSPSGLPTTGISPRR